MHRRQVETNSQSHASAFQNSASLSLPSFLPLSHILNLAAAAMHNNKPSDAPEASGTPLYESPPSPSSNPRRQNFNSTPPPGSPSLSPSMTPLAPTWEATRFVPLVPGENSPLLPDSESDSDGLLFARAGIQRARRASRDARVNHGLKDRFCLGCTMLVMFVNVVLIVTGGTIVLLSKQGMPKLGGESDWKNGGYIPLKYGCRAPGNRPISVPLRWWNVPVTATHLSIFVANPGVLDDTGVDPVHWFVTNIPLRNGKPGSLPANASADSSLLPAGARQLSNAFSKAGAYQPPCAKEKDSLFVIQIYATDVEPRITGFSDAREIMNRLSGVPLARIYGIYPKEEPAGEEEDNQQRLVEGDSTL